jgi:hypothetical protein
MKKRETVNCTVDYAFNQGSSKGRFGSIVVPKGFTVSFAVPKDGPTAPPPEAALIDAFKGELYEDEQDIQLSVTYPDEPMYVRFHTGDQSVEYYPSKLNGVSL